MCIGGIKQPQREVIHDHTRCENVGRCDGNSTCNDLDNHLTFDSFLDQTVHACARGIGLTELGRLILEERSHMKPHE